MENLVELKREELIEVQGGWLPWALRAARVVAVAAAAIHEVIHDDVCEGSSAGDPSDWASSACEGCTA